MFRIKASNNQVFSQLKSIEGLQKTETSLVQTNEIWFSCHVHTNIFTVVVAGMAANEKPTILEQRNELKYQRIV